MTEKNIQWGNMRRLTPVSRVFGLDRGMPIDRFYIEAFLQNHTKDIQGVVLEIEEPVYTRKFGSDRVSQSHVLHAEIDNPSATVVGDLVTGEGLLKDTFDCMILTQTLLVIYDIQSAIANCYHALKPGGVLLVTFPGISQISRYDMDRWGDYWRFTDASAQRLFGDVFGRDRVTVETYGNVLTACAFLQGLAAHELKQSELNYRDPDYQLLITVRAIK
ncbi:methyltransferase domain-containing protein [Spirulina sp. 06S082]|uniref:methyltransferase domain-containing protein n=1 Tax=Spirulina sp. 06S082 TaxID=3110248 RepID=UPI002B21CB53|nr:methyltransferase domain-containing protein [Spirulina sp. 06S082]MEA5472257.1 methyltransferase domain-containing protein [Spirulina sp. 06S082]